MCETAAPAQMLVEFGDPTRSIIAETIGAMVDSALADAGATLGLLDLADRALAEVLDAISSVGLLTTATLGVAADRADLCMSHTGELPALSQDATAVVAAVFATKIERGHIRLRVRLPLGEEQ